jgi:uncharacterized protein
MRTLFVLMLFLVMGATSALAYSSPGKPTGYLSDFAGILSAETKATLEPKLYQLEASTSAQIAVVTIKSLDGDTIENYAEKLFQDWGIGQKGKDNGALLLVAVDDREMRIEVGYGLEPIITDALSSRIIRNQITPAFKAGDYNRGILEGTEGLIAAAYGDETVGSITSAPVSGSWFEDMFGWIMLLFVFGQWFFAIMARTKSWWLGGVFGAIGGLIITAAVGFFAFGLIAFLFLIPLGLLLDYLVSKGYQKGVATGSYPWWTGGKSGFGSSSWGSGAKSGGFGGFGGGRSGGGGSSGRW